MSYAEQFFGVRENEAISFADNLAFYGVDSYVYDSYDMMERILNSQRAKMNHAAAFYIVKKLRDDAINLSGVLPLGFEISVFNSDLNLNFIFKLLRFNQDGSADFITKCPAVAGMLGNYESGTNSANLLNFEDYGMNQYLNSKEEDWFFDFNTYNSTVDTTYNNLIALRSIPGWLHGFGDDVLDSLKPFKTLEDSRSTKLVALVASSEDMTDMVNDLGYTIANLGKGTAQRTAIHFAKRVRDACPNDTVRQAYMPNSAYNSLLNPNQPYDIHCLEEITASQIESAVSKNYRGGITGNTLYSTAEALQQSSKAALSVLATRYSYIKVRL